MHYLSGRGIVLSVETLTLSSEDTANLMDMVKAIVRKHFNVPEYIIARDDLEQIGLLGALEAAKRWDPKGGAALTSFTWFRAYGAIQDFLRKNNTGTRRDPNRYQVLSLDYKLKGDQDDHDSTLADKIPAPEYDVDPLLSPALADALKSLSPEARKAIWLAHCEGWTRREIGERLGRREASVYQLIHRGVRKLRDHPALQSFDPEMVAA